MNRTRHNRTPLGYAWLLVLLFVAAAARAESQRVAVGPQQVGLLELYTSEGCSSCPPAERFFSSLLQDDALFDRVVPVAFHVDYWNYLGWRDRFSRAEYSERQRAHVRAGRGRSVYTPGFFFNGNEWRQFFGGDVNDFPPATAGGRLTVERDAEQVAISFAPLAAFGSEREAHVAVLGFGIETAVAAGENHGRTLRHDFIVLDTVSVALQRTADTWQGETRITVPDAAASRYALAVWVGAAPGGLPEQAAGLWLD